jgi:hypothetical protein
VKIHKCIVVTVWLIEDTNDEHRPFSVAMDKPSHEQNLEWRRMGIRVHEREFVIPDPSSYRGE